MDRSAATDLECRELVELVTDYLEGELQGEPRVRFEAHLAECEGCRRYVEQLRCTIRLTGRTRALGRRPEIRALLRARRASS